MTKAEYLEAVKGELGFMSYTISDMIMQIGIGCIMFGAGLLVSLGSVYIMVKIIPWIIRKIVDRGSKIVNGG